MKLNTTFTKSIFASASVALLLTACGGGGSSSSGNAPITPAVAKTQFPIEAAVTSLNTSSYSKTLGHTDAKGVVYTIDINSVPGGDASFNGKAAKTATQTTALKVNGVASGTSTQTFYFQINPFKVLGYLADDGAYVVANNQVSLPTSSAAGSSGNFYTLTEYASNLSSVPVSTTVATWSLEADTDNTAYFCDNGTDTKNAPNAQAEFVAECYKLDALGKVTGMKLTMTANGQSMIFTGQ